MTVPDIPDVDDDEDIDRTETFVWQPGDIEIEEEEDDDRPA